MIGQLATESRDGRRILFLANYGLTPSSSAGKEAATTCQPEGASAGNGCDLYEYRVVDPETGAGTLTDLSADVEASTTDTKGANARGVVGISEDGAYVYFSTSGQLVAGKGNSEATNETEETLTGKVKEANVYVSHEGGAPTYVTTIRKSEAGSSSNVQEQIDALVSSEKHGIQYLVARVSPDGQHLLFATREKPTGYNNLDPKTKSLSPELYEYALGTGSITCVSCSPTGEQPNEPEIGSGFAPYGPYLEVHEGNIWRNLLPDGRVFFDSFQPLVESAKGAETVNVYEWLPPGLEGCANPSGCVSILDTNAGRFPTYFVGASEDGKDVYVSTPAQLAPEDTDGSRDLYDVRVGGGRLFVPPTARCEANGVECQPSEGGQGPGVPHASESGVRGGNVPPGSPAGEGGVRSLISSAVKVTGHSVKGSTLTLVVAAPGSGRLTVTGSGLQGLRRSVTKGAKYRLKLTLGAKGRATLRSHRRVRVKVQVVFAPVRGKASSASVTVVFS
jgi:hypothetical protein